MSFEWFEGVALVRAVAEVVSEEFGGTRVPDLSQIEISPDGEVAVLGGLQTGEPVRRLGQLLQAVLSQAEPPVQLRLMIAQATAHEPAFGSSRELSEALGYFERPDRAGVLRRLHARALAASSAASEASPSIDLIAPLRDEEPASLDAAPAVAATGRRGAALMIGAVVFLVSVVASYWVFGGTAGGGNVAAMAVKASDAVGGAVVSGISKVSETVGLGRLAPADPTGSIPPSPVPAAAAPPAPKGSRKAAPTARGGSPDPFVLFDLDGIAGIPPALDALPARSAPEMPLASAAPKTFLVSDPTVYSAADQGVEPPIGLRPQLPRALPTDVNKDQLGQIELLILPDGTVGSVKLLGPHPTIIEAMLLSAAKAWTFQPAMKNGQPVRYRKRVWLVLP